MGDDGVGNVADTGWCVCFSDAWKAVGNCVSSFATNSVGSPGIQWSMDMQIAACFQAGFEKSECSSVSSQVRSDGLNNRIQRCHATGAYVEGKVVEKQLA